MLLPITAEVIAGEPCIVCVRADAVQFREPFFVDTLHHHLGISVMVEDDRSLVRSLKYDTNDPRLSRTPVADFIRRNNALGKYPCGFVLHTARCGSTLLMQMLSESRRLFVLSEPTILNTILDPLGPFRSSYNRADLLKAAIHCLVACAPEESRTVIKFRSWNTLYANIIQEVMPHTPWLFLHRSGVEVLSSVLKSPPGWLRARQRLVAALMPFLQLDFQRIGAMSDAEYAARMIGSFCRAAQLLSTRYRMVINYCDIVDRIESIAAHLGVILSDRELSMVRNRARFYSKDISQSQIFDPDDISRRRKTTLEEHLLAKKFIEPNRRAIGL